MKRLIYSGLCLIFLVLSLFWNATAQDDGSNDKSDIPYIYYFSADLNAVVIERADGTDTRILGDGLFETEPNSEQYQYYSSHKAEWSPSGEWLAWTVTYFPLYFSPSYKTRLFVISADGERVLPIVQSYHSMNFSWSPTEDVLVIYGKTGGFEPEMMVITLYDFTKNEIIFSQQISDETIPTKLLVNGRHPLLVQWSQYGEYITFEIYDEYPEIMYYFILNRNGTFYSFHRVADTIPVKFSTYYTPSTIADGWIVYPQPSLLLYSPIACTIMFNNIGTGEQHIIDLLENCPSIDLIVWNLEYDQALLVGESLWLWQNQSLIQLTMPYNYQYDSDCRIICNILNWSPDEQYAVLRGEDGLYIIDITTQETSLLIPFDGIIQTYRLDWEWLNKHEIIVSGYSGDNTIDYHFDLSSDRVEIHSEPFECRYPRLGGFALTSDGAIEVYMAEGLVIHNRNENSYTCLQPASASFGSDLGDYVSLSADEQWILWQDNARFNSGLPHYWGITHIDGTLQRDLTGPRHFAKWLPPQVDLRELPAPLTEPLYPSPIKVLSGENWINSIHWSPDGSSLLVDYRPAKDESGEAILRNIATGDSTFISTIDYVFHISVHWEQNNDGTFTPIIGDAEPVGEWRGWEIGAVSADESVYVVTETDDIYAMTTHEIISEVGCTGGIYIFDYAFSPDGAMLACPTGIWDVQTGEKLSDIPVAGRAFEFSPDGTRLAIGASWDILIYDVDELLAWELPE